MARNPQHRGPIRPVMTKAIALLAFLSTVATAEARPHKLPAATHKAPQAAKLSGFIVNIQSELEQLRRDGFHKPSYTQAKCDELAAESGTAEAKALCVEYGKWIALADAQKKVSAFATVLQTRGAMNPTDANVAAYREQASQCRAAVDAALAAGAPSNVNIYLGKDMPLSAAKAQICDPLDVASSGIADRAKEEKARLAAVTRRYADAGAAGDRLELLVHEDGSAWYGPGEVALSSAHDQSTAPVMFMVMRGGPNNTWQVARYEFAGNKLKQHTTAEYDKKPTAKAFK